MVRTRKTTRVMMPALVAGACLLATAGVFYGLHGRHHMAQIASVDGEATGSVDQADGPLGKSGLPLPRFVSLKSEKVNVRKGPSSDHPVAWVFQSKGLPVEITAEFENWRRIRDSEGSEGWILKNMLAGKRTALVAPWKKGQNISLMDRPAKDGGVVAQLASGVQSDIRSCDGHWCTIKVGSYSGYIDQSQIWGAYPGEVLN